MHSHHSHSGEFCQHAKNTLEEMVLRAIEKRLDALCLTEHIPRLAARHLYPEEVASGTSTADLATTFNAYFTQARRLQQKYAGRIEILVGFEGEGISTEYIELVRQLAADYKPDMFIGSLHHLGNIPIDYDQALWNDACEAAGGVESMYTEYFRQLGAVITALRPPVIAHFDLIRLFSPPFDLHSSAAWPLVEQAVRAGVDGGCLFEVNSAALRKGWSEPYPRRDVAELILASGGRFCLSDDAHNVDQVALNYKRVLEYLTSLGVTTIYRLTRATGGARSVPVDIQEFVNWASRD